MFVGETACRSGNRQSTRLIERDGTYNTSAQTTNRNQAWTMKTDGSGKKILFDLPIDNTAFSLNQTSQYPWSNVSRDGNFYAVQSTNNETKQSTVLVGAFAGGTPSGIANTTSGSVSLAGWTML